MDHKCPRCGADTVDAPRPPLGDPDAWADEWRSCTSCDWQGEP